MDDEPYILPTLSALLSGEFEVITADSAASAEAVFAHRHVDIILTDQRMPQKTGVELLEWVRVHHPKTIRLLMTGYAELEDAVEAINRGQVYHYLLKPWRTEELLQILRNACEKHHLERNQERLLDELKQRTDELHRLNAELELRVHQRTRELEDANRLLQQRTRELETLALTDPLTGLLNRRAIDEVAKREVARRTRYGSPLALGIIDADHFREINRRYYLPGGDQVLIALAKTVAGSLREVDSVGRIGGEEFLVVAPETSCEGAKALAERIRSRVERTQVVYKDQPIAVTVSIGFAVVEAGATADYDQLKHLSAQAMGEAKAGGRNRSVIKCLQSPDTAA